MRSSSRSSRFPGGIGSHCTPETPGSIHEGGELGYSLSHACGAAFDNPDLIVAVGRRRRRSRRPARWRRAGTSTSSSTRSATARSCRSCTSTATRSTTRRSARASRTRSSRAFFRGYGWTPYFVEGVRPRRHAPGDGRDDRASASRTSARVQKQARSSGKPFAPALADDRPAHAKGWTGPAEVGRAQARRLLAVAPGAAGRRARKTRRT